MNKVHIIAYNKHLSELIEQDGLEKKTTNLEDNVVDSREINKECFEIMAHILIKARDKVESGLNKETIHNQGYYKRNEGWWSEELERLHNRRREIHKRFLEDRSSRYRLLLKVVRTEIKRIKRENKKKMRQKEVEKLMHHYKVNKMKFWQRAKTLRKSAEDVNIDDDVLLKHYEDIFNTPNTNARNLTNDLKIDDEVRAYIRQIESMPKGNIVIEVGHMRTILKKLKMVRRQV